MLKDSVAQARLVSAVQNFMQRNLADDVVCIQVLELMGVLCCSVALDVPSCPLTRASLLRLVAPALSAAGLVGPEERKAYTFMACLE